MMDRALDLEGAFARAVLDAEADVPAPVVGRQGGSPSRRFAVYRNNVYASLIDVLGSRFPVSARLVGEEFFRAMARLYVEKTPPASPVLLRYGADFADFIGAFPPASAVPYLADVARLEWAWHRAYHAKDAAPLSLSDLAEVGETAEGAVLTLHPSLQVVCSDYPVVTIWQLALRDGENEPARLPAEGEDALVVRPNLEVEVRRLPSGGAHFVKALAEGATLLEAASRASGEAPAFDLEANLAGLMTSGVIVAVAARKP
ncbi:MAG: HvfC/BufC N-terminal domain-containing protein [Methyloceanibacter sp.]|uniref:HvfC/BufC N-terminal domain-containing protein n=1 Tax=Methyloceanibacter sp. TaxID=1965321 RepID=UPI003EE0862F